jgi:heme oxygenase
VVRRPWQLGTLAVVLVDMYASSVEEIRALKPPLEDAADLEQHFLRPLDAQVKAAQEWARSVRADLKRLRLRKLIADFEHLGHWTSRPTRMT